MLREKKTGARRSCYRQNPALTRDFFTPGARHLFHSRVHPIRCTSLNSLNARLMKNQSGKERKLQELRVKSCVLNAANNNASSLSLSLFLVVSCRGDVAPLFRRGSSSSHARHPPPNRTTTGEGKRNFRRINYEWTRKIAISRMLRRMLLRPSVSFDPSYSPPPPHPPLLAFIVRFHLAWHGSRRACLRYIARDSVLPGGGRALIINFTMIQTGLPTRVGRLRI